MLVTNLILPVFVISRKIYKQILIKVIVKITIYLNRYALQIDGVVAIHDFHGFYFHYIIRWRHKDVFLVWRLVGERIIATVMVYALHLYLHIMNF